jgi:hypothetical protein
VKLRQQRQHFRDEEEVRKVVARVAARDRQLEHAFPRPIEDIITLGSEVSVTVERVEGLNAGFVVRTLRDRYRVNEAVEDDEARAFAGYTYAQQSADRTFAVIFCDEQYGEPAQRFTLAHEAGHLFREFVCDLEAAKQGTLFGKSPAPKLMVARDPPGYVRRGFDARPEDVAAWSAEHTPRKHSPEGLRETKAHGFAAELLAPFRAVQHVFRENPGREREEYVELLRVRFHVSRTMARVRLAELIEEPDPDQSVMDLVT